MALWSCCSTKPPSAAPGCAPFQVFVEAPGNVMVRSPFSMIVGTLQESLREPGPRSRTSSVRASRFPGRGPPRPARGGPVHSLIVYSRSPARHSLPDKCDATHSQSRTAPFAIPADGESDTKRAALAFDALHVEPRAMTLQRVLHDRESQTRTAAVARSPHIDAIEALGQPRMCSAGMPMPLSITEKQAPSSSTTSGCARLHRTSCT